MVSCNASSNCRIEWRPSPLLAILLCLLAALAALALALSGLPGWLSSLIGLVALGSTIREAWRGLQKPVWQFVWAGGSEPALMSGARNSTALSEVSIHWRGPMAVLRGRDPLGRWRCWVWYPDTLSPRDRRALRLVAVIPPSPFSQLPLVAA